MFQLSYFHIICFVIGRCNLTHIFVILSILNVQVLTEFWLSFLQSAFMTFFIFENVK